MRELCAQDNFLARKTLAKLYSSSTQKSIMWPLIWFCTLDLLCCFPTNSGFRRIPSEISSSTWLNGGVPMGANIAQQNRACLLAGQPQRSLGLVDCSQAFSSSCPRGWRSGEALPAAGPRLSCGVATDNRNTSNAPWEEG